jgi:GAF domain-containing protein
VEDPAFWTEGQHAIPTSHVREMAANLMLGRVLNLLEAACGLVVFLDAEGRWNQDSMVLPGRSNRVSELAPVLEALIEWTLYSELPVVVDNLTLSRWSRYLLSDKVPPSGSIAATPLAQRGTIWGAVAVYRPRPVSKGRQLLQQLAELATEPLSSLGAGRPEGVKS